MGEVTAVPCLAVSTWLLCFPSERSKSLMIIWEVILWGCQGMAGTISLPISALNMGDVPVKPFAATPQTGFFSRTPFY